jgi:hypothetical protein
MSRPVTISIAKKTGGFLRWLLLVFTLITGLHTAHAQVFPVQGSAALIPPYSVKLGEYSTATTDRLVLNVLMNDITRPELRVRFRLRIEGQRAKIETKPEYIGTAISLAGGIPQRLTNIDLAEYFNPNNLNFSGISRSEFLKTGALPEGFYQFCFEVLEYNRGVKISNTICVPAWLILNDPPLVNTPRNGEKLRPLSVQNVVFQWTPRHTGSPNSAFNTEYEFKLVELWPSTRNPNDAILTQPAIYETVTNSTMLVYGPDATPLEQGRHYAFRVRAKSITGIDELDLFKNNGYSEVVTFIYGDACTPPGNIVAESSGANRFGVTWVENPNHSGYSVRYKKANSANENWYTANSLTSDVRINSLQPNTKYIYQVKATCGAAQSDFSMQAVVTTKAADEVQYSCGLPLTLPPIDPSQLIEQLKVGDIIQAGDFSVTLAKVTGSNGTFSGDGVIEVPYFNKAKVKAEFSGISVNKDLRMVGGVMNVTGAAVEIIPAGVMDFVDKLDEVLAFADSAIANIESNLPEQIDPNTFIAEKEIKIDGTIVTVIKAADGSAVVVDDKGNRTTIPAGTTAAVTDSQGNAYLIDKKGNAHATTPALAAQAANREYNLSVKFANAPNARFGFDGYKHSALAAKYEKLTDEQYASWKSVETGQTDVALTLLDGTTVDKSQIRFEQGGNSVVAQPSGTNANAQVLTVRSSADGVEEGLVALYTPADTARKEQVLGKLNVVTYDAIKKTVVIVPVNGNTFDKFGTIQLLQDSLNRIYGQAIVQWTVQLAPQGIQVPGISPFNEGGTGLLSNFTDHMKAVINAYSTNIKDDTYYLFLVNNPTDPGVLGVMPRSKNFGFIFTDKHSNLPAIARTMAHELGHGAFNLHHTFMEPNLTIGQGLTKDNLMDYPAGNKLYKYQWDKMRYPDIVVGMFESDEEGELFKSDLLLVKDYLIDGRQISSYSNSSKISYVAPNGKIIVLPAEAKVSFSNYVVVADNPIQSSSLSKNAIGVVTQFQTGGKIYTAKFTGGSFTGYYQSNVATPYSEISSLSEDNVIIGVEFNDCKIKFMYGKYHVATVTDFTDFRGVTLDGEGELIGVKAVDPTKCIKCSIPLSSKPAELRSILELLEKDLEDSGIDDLLSKVSEDQMRNFICAKERYDLINNVSQGTLVGDEDEKTIIKLVRSTPDDQAKDLIDLFKNDTSGALKELYSSIDGEELSEFFGEMSKLYFRSLGQSHQQVQKAFDDSIQEFLSTTSEQDCDLLEGLAERNVFVLHMPQVVNTSSNTIIKYEINPLLGFGLNDDGTVDFLMSHNKCLFSFAKVYTVKPFELVKVIYLTSDRNNKLDEGYIPGYSMRWLLNNYNSTQIAIGINKGILISSIFTAGTTSEISVFVWSTVDFVISYGNLFIIQNQDELAKTEEGKKFVNAWNEINKYVMIAQGTHLLYGVGRNFIAFKLAVSDLKAAFNEWKFKNLDELKKVNPELAAKLESFGAQGIQKLDDLIAEYELQAQKISSEFKVSREMAEELMADEEFIIKYSKRESINVQEYIDRITANSAAKIGARKYFKGLTDAHYDKIDDVLGDRAQSFINEIEDNPAIKVGAVEEIEALAKTKIWRQKANDTYTDNGYNYQTDKYGRIERVEGDFKLDGVERHPDGPLVGQGDGKLPNDVGGHLVGRQFGGAGDATNVVPMDKSVNAYSNSGKFGQHEIRWRRLLVENPQNKLHVEIIEIFNPGNFTIRADAFRVTETLNGVRTTYIIPNN